MSFGQLRRMLFLSVFLTTTLLQPLAAVAQEPGPPASVPALLDALENGDSLSQEQAAQALAVSGATEAIPRLREIFLSADTPRPAAIALAGIGTPRAMAILVRALSDDELTPLRNAAQIGLLEASERAVPALLVGLQNPLASTRRNSAEMLGFIGSRRAINSLLRLVHTEDAEEVRVAAVWAMGRIDDPRVRGTLRAIARTDPSLDVRLEAQRAALRVGQPF